MQAGVMMELLSRVVADIPADGLSLVGEVTAEDLGLSEADTLVRSPLSVSMDLARADDMITVTGVLEGTAVRQCVRCLKEYDDPLVFSIHAAFAREGNDHKKKEIRAGARRGKDLDPRKGRSAVAKVEPELEETEESDERYFYQGDLVELAPMLREHVILAAPMQPLCREDCAGLCARCGKDLNDGPCHCPVEPPPTAFRVIRSTK